MKPALPALLGAALLTSGCQPTSTVLPQDVFAVDGVSLRVPPPPGFVRLERGEGRSRGSAYTTAAAFGVPATPGGSAEPRAFLVLLSKLGRDDRKHVERFRLIRDSWRAREAQEPSELEREARLRLGALDRGHADSAAWAPAGERRTLFIGIPLAGEDAVVQLTADMPETPGEALRWRADGLVLVRGRVLQLECTSPPGGDLDALATTRGTMLAWVAAVRTSAAGPTRPRRRFSRS